MNTTAQIKKNIQKGFTLIELLVVIGILAILLAITLIAINPSRQFQLSNNTKRSADVNAILNAINQYATDNKGTLPTGIITNNTATVIANTGVDLCSQLVTKYLAAFPTDPTSPTSGTPVTDCSVAYNTNYNVSASSTDNRVTVNAPNAQLGATIQVTR